MTDMKRSTGGLLQGEERTVRREDFARAVRFLDTVHGANPDLVRRLGGNFARQYATAGGSSSSTPSVKSQVQDLQRAPKR